ncbi:glycosyltransferase [Hanstruepera marina]|uniref:glycosyltransferase n=1 Tax=Hanstruepera marina TaxID=2873265 RepID=UPI001CA79474|nr:glycosyltransferase [Hanstruepera marina]
MKLCIISHTEHYQTASGEWVGWGPTVSELNHLAAHFETIFHIAMLHLGTPPPSALPYTASNIQFVALPPSGGRTIAAKIQSIWKAPKVIKIVSQTLKKADVFQLRTPTGIGVYLIPYLTLFVKKPGWYKYAGNWNQANPPLGYRLQRWMLKKQSRKVTINGHWPNQPVHCLTFENPCLTEADLEAGLAWSKKKTYKSPLTFCYVGRLELEKGVGRIIQAFTELSPEAKAKVKTVHLVGDGPERPHFEAEAQKAGVEIRFHGYLPREQVFEVFKISDIFLMPTTASEGFPKVIAEAMNFGCIPVVSNVSAIAQYVINGKQGYILDTVSLDTIQEVLYAILKDGIDGNIIKNLKGNRDIVNRFSFKHYNNRILKLLEK